MAHSLKQAAQIEANV